MESAPALEQLRNANEVKRRKKQSIVWSLVSVIVFIIAYVFPLGNALAGRIVLTFVAIIGLSSIATLLLLHDVKPAVTREQAALLGLGLTGSEASTANKSLSPAFSRLCSCTSNVTPPRTRRLSLTPPKPNLPLTPPQQNSSNFTKSLSMMTSSTPGTSPVAPTKYSVSTPAKQYSYNTSPMQEKRVFIATPTSKRRKIEMEEYIKGDIDDRCVDALRKCLGQHLQESVKRFGEIVKYMVEHMVQLQLISSDSSLSIVATLEYSEITRSRYYPRTESSASAQDIITMCKNMQPQVGVNLSSIVADALQAIPPQLHPVANNLLALVTEYNSLLLLFSGMLSTTSNTSAISPAVIGYGIKRCRELAVDAHLGRVHWPSISPAKSSTPPPIPDPALVMSIFFHYADSRSVGGKNQHTFSSMHYTEDYTDAIPTKNTLTNIRIARRSALHYNLYVDTPASSTTKLSQCEVCIEEGRQNCFLAIMLFLHTMVQLGEKMRGSLAPIKDLVEDVLGVDAI